jgi:hypothetical protein
MNSQAIILTEFVCETPNAKLRIWLDGAVWSGFAVIYDPTTGRNQVISFSSETEEKAKAQALKLASHETAKWRPARLTVSPLMRSAAAGVGGSRI